jgi:hypothetical protein
MDEPEEFNLLLSLLGGIVILFVLACGGLVYFFLGRPKVAQKFPVVIPIRYGILSFLGVLAIALALSGVRSLLQIFSV